MPFSQTQRNKIIRNTVEDARIFSFPSGATSNAEKPFENLWYNALVK